MEHQFLICNLLPGRITLDNRERNALVKHRKELGGKITIGTGDVKIRELVSQALEDGKKEILFDLGDVKAIDSSGIGEMVACYTTVTKRGGQLKLMHLSPKINDILQVTQLLE